MQIAHSGKGSSNRKIEVYPPPRNLLPFYRLKKYLYQAEMNQSHLSSRWLKLKGEEDGFIGLIQEREKPSEQFPFQAG